MNVYLDHAATTPLHSEVKSCLISLMDEVNGNPSSIHRYGRDARQKIEEARKNIAAMLGAEPTEICFTSSGTEADNMAVITAVRQNNIRHVLSSPIEHHAVLNTFRQLADNGEIELDFITPDSKGHIDLNEIEDWLKKHPGSLVSLMHANNEIGTMIDLKEVGDLCHSYDALFHTDTVQTIGYFNFNLQDLPVDYLAGSAHKFYGPKGIGFLYHASGCKVGPLIYGGGQEKRLRAGTENVHGIYAMAKALEVMEQSRQEFAPVMKKRKQELIDKISSRIPEAHFNGDPEGQSHYTVVNVTLPKFEGQALFFARLDQAGIAASGGSACSGGGSSHVIETINPEAEGVTVRFSIGTSTTSEEIEYTVDKVMEIMGVTTEVA